MLIPPVSVYARDATEKIPVAEGPPQKINDYFITRTLTYGDGTIVSRDVISGPPMPPPGYEFERKEVALPAPDPAGGANTLTVPAYKWVFGCSAVAASMIAAYYDRNGFPDIYTGPTSGGVMPLTEDASWGTWTDIEPRTFPHNPLTASHQWLDGRAMKGSIEDYWVQVYSSTPDPYYYAWVEHTWGDAIGDYMKTSQFSRYGNIDGATSFYNWGSGRLTCDDMEAYGWDIFDGTYGRKLFYEARGYRVTDCYNQRTDNNGGGFTFAMYRAEIDAGRPVLLNLQGHSVVGIGYFGPTCTVYIHDGWDNSDHTMAWGGAYSGMQLQSVSVVNLEGSIVGRPDIISLTPSAGAAGTSVIIAGSTFGPTRGASTVTFNGMDASVSSWTNTVIMCTVPVGATTGPVVVTNMGGESNPKTFTVKKPLVSGFSPASGTIGASVKISGNYFGASQGASTVTFGGVSASIDSWTNTVIMCTVPVGATTGPVVVTSLGGGSNPKTFTVKKPLIRRLFPASGTIGATVRISGNYFGPTQGASTVTFNGMEASVSSWTNTVITTSVPVGATTGPVVVTSLAGESNEKVFTVKP